jgi:GNAT superfamily N-acetyltransferase
MSLPDFINRPWQFVRRHGLRATLNRLGTSAKRVRTGNWHILFVCDLGQYQPSAQSSAAGDLKNARVERKNSESELSSEDLSRISSIWNPAIARRQLAERFAQGASLWLFKLDDHLAAFGWTIIGQTMERHFHPLGKNDAHLFDYFVFPEYRGRRINPALVNHVLSALATGRRNHAFIEAAEWNVAQLSSLGKTPFRPFGRAWKGGFFGKTFVLWDRNTFH